MLHPVEEAHIGVSRAQGCQIETLDGGVALLHPATTMRSFNCLSCWSSAALPRLMPQALSFYRARQRTPAIALTDLLPSSAHESLIGAGWQPAHPGQLFMERSGPPPSGHADLSIRPLVPAQIERFVALIAAGFGWSDQLQAEQIPLYQQQLAQGIGLHYVALLNDQLVGTASIVPSVTRQGTGWGLYKVVTHPAYRQRGVARALIRRALQDAAYAGARSVFLYTNPAGVAVSLYEQLAFVPRFCRTLYIWP